MKLLLFMVFITTVSAVTHETPYVDPELFLTNSEMIRYWGYPAEDFTAITEDGYILGMQRIPYGKNGPNTDGSCRPVVFMQHGLLADATSYTINLPEQSAGFMFADAGFDVWLGNFRGNTYSKNHVSLNASEEKFWEFSWDEMSQYDLQAQIEIALNVTGQNSLYYIGHSQGTLTMFSKLSVDPVFSKKIKKFFALAPVGSVANIQGLFRSLAEKFNDDMNLFYDLFGSREFLPNSLFVDLLAEWVCGTETGEEKCDNLLATINGPESSDQFNATRSEVYFSHNPAGTSSQNVAHWMQMVVSGTVSRFDYGSSKKNQQKYGTSVPPSYDFSTIATDMYLYWSDEDWLADPQDIQNYLLPSLNKNYVKGNVHLSGYTHLDYIWGLRAADEIYTPIINLIVNELGGKLKC